MLSIISRTQVVYVPGTGWCELCEVGVSEWHCGLASLPKTLYLLWGGGWSMWTLGTLWTLVRLLAVQCVGCCVQIK
jgi:hypothetical protein